MTGGAARAIIATLQRVGIASARAGGKPRMTITIRDMHEHDLDSVLALNNAAGATILPLDNARTAG